MLNYGYGILYSKISEAIIKAHLNPELSYLHKPEANRPSLVYDLIEEFRNQGVDRVVFAILAKNNKLTIINGQMDNKTRNIVVDKILARINSIEIFRGHEMRFGEIIQYQANSLAKYLTGKIKTYKPYIKKW
jgi:CRISPR-associated protein Cas1